MSDVISLNPLQSLLNQLIEPFLGPAQPRVSQNWQTTGTVSEPSPVLCRHERMLVPIADRIGKILYEERSPGFLHKHYNAAYPVLSLIEDARPE